MFYKRYRSTIQKVCHVPFNRYIQKVKRNENDINVTKIGFTLLDFNMTTCQHYDNALFNCLGILIRY